MYIIINPFKPGLPVPPGTFAGRINELKLLERAIIQTSYFSPQNILIIGERGIGKTSVAYVSKAIAQDNFISLVDKPQNPLITIFVSVQKNTPSVIVLTRIIEELEEKLGQYSSLITSAVGLLNAFIKKFKSVNVKGVQFELGDGSLVTEQEIYYEAKKTLRRCAEGCFNQQDIHQRRSICIIIDELDRMKDFDSFSSFWKSLQETLAADNINNLMLIMVGMPEIRELLANDHESFLRTFTPIILDRMTESDAREVISKVLFNSGKTNTNEAVEKILLYSERFPHLIQEIGYSAYEVCSGDQIVETDIERGLHGTDNYLGSVKRLGELFFSRMYDEVKKSSNFKEVLKIVANKSGENYNWVTRQEILKDFSLKKTSLDSAIRTLKDKKMLIKNPDAEGEYRLFSKMFQVFIGKLFD